MPLTVSLDQEIDVSRGDLLFAASHPPLSGHDRVEAVICWMHEQPLVMGAAILHPPHLKAHLRRGRASSVPSRCFDSLDP